MTASTESFNLSERSLINTFVPCFITQCGKSFSTKSNLKSHLYSHSTEKVSSSHTLLIKILYFKYFSIGFQSLKI